LKLLWGFAIVPTTYAVYIVVDKENGILRFVKEFDTKGHAVKWIAKSGEKGITYCIQTHSQGK
jgi:hypothetical protein